MTLDDFAAVDISSNIVPDAVHIQIATQLTGGATPVTSVASLFNNTILSTLRSVLGSELLKAAIAVLQQVEAQIPPLSTPAGLPDHTPTAAMLHPNVAAAAKQYHEDLAARLVPAELGDRPSFALLIPQGGWLKLLQVLGPVALDALQAVLKRLEAPDTTTAAPASA